MIRTIYDAIPTLPAMPYRVRYGRLENTRELVIPRLPYVVITGGREPPSPDNLPRRQSGCGKRVGHDQLPDSQTLDRKVFNRDRFEVRFGNSQTANDEAPYGQSGNCKCADGEGTEGEGTEGIGADRGTSDAHLSKLSNTRHMTHIYHGTSGSGT